MQTPVFLPVPESYTATTAGGTTSTAQTDVVTKS
jgi:hypothetical protein